MESNVSAAALRSLLQPGEMLQWQGGPAPGIHLTREEKASMPFALLGCGTLGYMIFQALKSSAGFGFFTVFLCVFALLALYILVGRFLHEALRRKRAYYGVTDQRIILLDGTDVVSVPYDQIPVLEKQMVKNDIGIIYVAERVVRYKKGQAYETDRGRAGLLFIPQVDRIYQLIQSDMLRAKS